MILPDFVSLYSTQMLLNKSNVPFIARWCYKTQNTQQHVQHGILVKVKIEEDDCPNRTYSNSLRFKLHMHCTHVDNMVLRHDIHHSNINLVHFFTHLYQYT